MKSEAPFQITPQTLSPRHSLWFAALFAAAMIICLPYPRMQSFLPGALGALAFVWFYFRYKGMPGIDRALSILIVCLLGLGCLSTLWAGNPDYVLTRALKTTATMLPALAILFMACTVSAQTPHKDLIIRIVVLACGIAGTAFFFEYYGGYTFMRFYLGLGANDIPPPGIQSKFLLNRNTVYLVLLSMPALLGLYACALPRARKIVYAGILLTGIIAVLCVTESQTAQIAVCIMAAMLLFPSHLKIARRLLMGGLLVSILIAPLVPTPAQKAFLAAGGDKYNGSIMKAASIPHRLEVWNFIAEKIRERPLLGHGMDSTRFLKAAYIMPHMKTNHVMHPHNAMLQVWIEFGLVGALVASALVIILFRNVETLPLLLQRYYIMMMIVMLGVLSTGYGLWQAWQIGFLFSIPAFSIMVTRLYPDKFRLDAA